jgi:hypothetical protein
MWPHRSLGDGFGRWRCSSIEIYMEREALEKFGEGEGMPQHEIAAVEEEDLAAVR